MSTLKIKGLYPHAEYRWFGDTSADRTVGVSALADYAKSLADGFNSRPY